MGVNFPFHSLLPVASNFHKTSLWWQLSSQEKAILAVEGWFVCLFDYRFGVSNICVSLGLFSAESGSQSEKLKKANELLRAHLPYLSPAWIGLKQPPSTSLNPVLVVDMVEIEVHYPHHL